jgi:transposase
MLQGTGLAELLGLAGVRVDLAEQDDDGSWTVYVASVPDRRVCCPACGQQAGRVKERVAHGFRHLVLAAVRVVWDKCRFWCPNQGCEQRAFAEVGPVGAGAGVGERARTVMGHLVGDWLVPVSRVAAGAEMSWHTVHDAFVTVATQAGVHVSDTTADAEAGDGAETGNETTTGSEAGEAGAAAAVDVQTGAATQPGAPVDSTSDIRRRRHTHGLLPPVEVLGIDDHRRGRPLYHRDPATGKWVADADRWQTVFVDAGGAYGLLGQAEGRASADVTGWLAGQDPAWRAAVRYVTIDMSSVYKSAVATGGLLPGARLVVDLFHVVQLANKTVADVRRRVTYARYGRRGRASDPEYAIKNPLRRGKERLSDNARHKLLCTLSDLGEAGREIGAAWRAKELVRDLVKLSPGRHGQAPTRTQVAAALEAFFTFAATTGSTVPEVVTLAETISTWRAEIARGVLTGHTNAASEGVNRLVKLVYRAAFGFTNVTNQQRRSRYAASRATRPEWLHTVTATPSHPVAA